jgi:DNA-binding transcriptional MerR regulator
MTVTVQEAAATTGWSARMLRYIEQSGLVVPARSGSGYRLYGPAELRRLRTLRELLLRFGLRLEDLAFSLRQRRDAELHEALGAWFDESGAGADRATATDWLHWEQRKHQRLLSAA